MGEITLFQVPSHTAPQTDSSMCIIDAPAGNLCFIHGFTINTFLLSEMLLLLFFSSRVQ